MTSPNLGILLRHPRTRDLAGLLGLVAASSALVAAFLPWARSGKTSRSSFELIGAADRLDLLDGAARHLALGWYLLPILVGLAWLAWSLGRGSLAATLSVLAGSLAVAAAELTQESPLAVDIGAKLARWSGLAAVSGAVAHLAMTRSRSR